VVQAPIIGKNGRKIIDPSLEVKHEEGKNGMIGVVDNMLHNMSMDDAHQTTQGQKQG